MAVWVNSITAASSICASIEPEFKAFINNKPANGEMAFDQTESYIRVGAGNYILNKWGIKGPYFEEKKGKDVYRILVFGGSTTQGSFENELDYPRVLERMLNNKLKDKTYYQVINVGQVGSAICRVKKKFFEYLPKFKPDMIILATGLNDFATSKTVYLNIKNFIVNSN